MKTRALLAAILVLGLSGCFWAAEEEPKYTFPAGVSNIRLIAVMPVLNNTKDAAAPKLLRNKILDELYFKGYPRIPFEVIDEKLAQAFRGEPDYFRATAAPDRVGELVGADAVLYSTLREAGTSYSYYVSAPVTVSVDFELKGTKTGEVLWHSSQKAVVRNFDVTRKRLEMKSSLVYEEAIQEAVSKAMATMPEGPNSPG